MIWVVIALRVEMSAYCYETSDDIILVFILRCFNIIGQSSCSAESPLDHKQLENQTFFPTATIGALNLLKAMMMGPFHPSPSN